jgi:hypothetical protein
MMVACAAMRFLSSTSIPWNASIAALASVPSQLFLQLDDLPEKWTHYAEINASYDKADKFTPEEDARHQTK